MDGRHGAMMELEINIILYMYFAEAQYYYAPISSAHIWAQSQNMLHARLHLIRTYCARRTDNLPPEKIEEWLSPANTIRPDEMKPSIFLPLGPFVS